MKKLTPHDAFFRLSLGNSDIARDVFQAHLPPALLRRVDLDYLQPCPETYIEKGLPKQVVDVLY